MRILLLITDLEIGGTPTVVRELAKRLAGDDVTIEAACLSGWGPVAGQIAAAGTKVTALQAGSRWDVRVVARLAELIRRERFDAVMSLLIHSNAIAAAASLFCPHIRFIQAIQTTQPEPHWHWWLQALAHHAADRVLVPSLSVAEAAMRWADIPRDKIVVIPNAVDWLEFRGLRDRSATIQKTTWRIGFIGRLDPVKCVDDLLKALAFLPAEVELEIFGGGQEERSLKGLAESLGVGKRIRFHGVIESPAAALGEIDLLVLPSRAEGFGLVLIEAMAAGVPVVATDVPGIRNVVLHEINGLLTPAGNPQRLATTIQRVIGDDHLRRRLIEGGKQTVRSSYTWESVLPRYRQLLGIDPPSAP